MKLYLTKFIAKTTYYFLKTFNLGSGYTWPGHLALKIYPNLLKDNNFVFKKGLILITGTNGKTTTTKLLSHILKQSGYSVITNDTGANLVNGIVSALVLSSSLSSGSRGDVYDFGIFEVDEFHLNSLVLEHGLVPDGLVLLNLSRDQLDRYGELDTITERWKPLLPVLAEKGSCLFYYENQPEFVNLLLDFISTGGSLAATTFSSNDSLLERAPLKGVHNSINLDASYKVSLHFGILHENFIDILQHVASAYGRGEVLRFKDKNYHIHLAKNPVSFDNNLLLLNSFDFDTTCLVFILNDNIPDGLDVSWIYDIDSDLLNENVSKFSHIFISGQRGLDMAVRLHYAGLPVSKDNVFEGFDSLLSEITSLKEIKDVVILPNYSAMLDFRKKLTGKSIL